MRLIAEIQISKNPSNTIPVTCFFPLSSLPTPPAGARIQQGPALSDKEGQVLWAGPGMRWMESGLGNPHPPDCSCQNWEKKPGDRKDPNSSFPQLSLGLDSCLVISSTLNVRATSSTWQNLKVFSYILFHVKIAVILGADMSLVL